MELSEDGSPRRIRLETVGDYGAEALRGFIAGAVEPGAWTVTDGWSGYIGLPDNPRGRRVVGGRPAHEVLRWIHRVFPDLRRRAMGAYHGLRRKRTQRYLDGFVFRWNRRRRRRTSFDRLPGIGLWLTPATSPTPPPDARGPTPGLRPGPRRPTPSPPESRSFRLRTDRRMAAASLIPPESGEPAVPRPAQLLAVP